GGAEAVFRRGPRLDVAHLGLDERAQIAGRVMMELDHAMRLAIEDDDVAASDLRRGHRHGALSCCGLGSGTAWQFSRWPARASSRGAAVRSEPVGEEWPDLALRVAAHDQLDMAVVAGEAGVAAGLDEQLVGRAGPLEQAATGVRRCEAMIAGAGDEQQRQTQVRDGRAILGAVAAGPVAPEVPVHPLLHDAGQLVLGTEAEEPGG